MYWDFKIIPFTLCTYVLAKILQNGAKFLHKTNSWFKNRMRNLVNYRQAVESHESWNLIGYFCPKNTFLQLKHIQRIYAILLSTSYVKMCHFRNRMLFFMTQPLYIFLAQTLDTFYKSSLSKWKFPGLRLLALKFTKFLMSFLKPRVSFSSNFASLSSVMKLTLLYIFI